MLRIILTLTLAWQSSVIPPVLSLVPDNARGLRPLIGIAGAASIGSTLDLGFEVHQVAVPPNHDYILATTSHSNWPVLLSIEGGRVGIRPIDIRRTECESLDSPSLPLYRKPRPCARESVPVTALPGIDRIALSPTGSSAAFFSESTRQIYAIGNMQTAPSLIAQFDVSALGTLTTFGITDDGRTVAVAVSDGDAGSLFFLNARQLPRRIASIRHASAIRFLRRAADAIITDDVESKVYGLASGQIFSIAGDQDGLSAPIAIAVSNDDRRVFIANAGTASITTIGVAGGAMGTLACNCSLTGLHPTNTDSVFRLTDFSGGPIVLFDANSPEPRMVFVPVSSR